MNVVTAMIGLLAAFTYLGALMWAIAAWPFIVITVVVMLLILYDFAITAFDLESGQRR